MYNFYSMRVLPFSLVALSCGLVLTPVITCAQDTPSKSTSPASNSAADQMAKKLLAMILKKSPDEWSTLADSPSFSKSLMRWKLLDGVDASSLATLMRTPFMKAFMNDSAWQEGVMGSGPIPNMTEALNNLAILCKKDPKALTNPIYKKLASATALEFARNESDKKLADKKEWTRDMMMERYEYFRSSSAAKLLNPGFDKLDYWDMRVLAGSKMGGWGRAKSLAWQRDNVRLPAQQYTWACWQAPYWLNNQWGESIHGPEYYHPFVDIFSGQAQMTKEIGGVCGSLSHYGAFAAIANGVPALTMGEPGHCAYVVRIDDKTWEPGYSLTWQRGCHWNFYGEPWSLLILTQDIFSDKKALQTALHLSWMAQLADKCGDQKMAEELYQAALKAQPHNYAIWTEFLDRAVAQEALTADQWKEVSSQVLSAFGKDYPEVANMLLSKKVYPLLMAKLDSPKDKATEIEKFHKSLDKMLPTTWDFPAALNAQESLLGGGEDAIVQMIDILMDAHKKSDDYGAPSLSWCMQRVQDSPPLLNYFVSKVTGASGEMNENALFALASDMIKKAETSHDMLAFQSVGKLLGKHIKPRLPEFEPFPGELLSSGGLLNPTSVSSAYDKPWQHWGVLEKCGGNFHTNQDDPGGATVTLPRIGDLSGIVLITLLPGFEYRGNGTIVEVSLDGATWTKVATLDRMERVNRINLEGKNARAKFVRVSRPGKEFYHLDGFLVYGKKAS